MAATTPTFGPIAEDFIGFGFQTDWVNKPGDTSEVGNPGHVYANAASTYSWVEFLSRSLKYTSGQQLIDTGQGYRSSRRKIRRGAASTGNGWTNFLLVTQGVGLLKAFFGNETVTGSSAPYSHRFSTKEGGNANNPKLLTVLASRRGRWFQYTDCLLATMQLQLTSDEWHMVWTVMGGEGRELDSTAEPGGGGGIAAPSITDDPTPLEWGHLISASPPNSIPQTDLRSLTITWDNALIDARSGGTFHRSKAVRGNYKITGSMELDYDSAAVAQQWANAAAGTVDTSGVTNDLQIVIGTGASAKHSIVVKRLFVSDPDFNDTLGESERLTVPFEAFQPSNDSTWTAVNATAGAYA